MEVLEHINQKISEYKEEDGNLYAIYGTPAENLCGLQVKQFRKSTVLLRAFPTGNMSATASTAM